MEADPDQFGGCHAFAKTILQRSQDKIGLLGNDLRYIVNQSRRAGFNKAVDELKFPRQNIYLRTELGTAKTTAAAVKELLALGVRRFVAMDDDVCIFALAALEEAGLKVPQDVQIASLFDSTKLEQHHCPVSALRFDNAELGTIVCRELLRCLRAEMYDPKPILGYRIISRASI